MIDYGLWAAICASPMGFVCIVALPLFLLGWYSSESIKTQ